MKIIIKKVAKGTSYREDQDVTIDIAVNDGVVEVEIGNFIYEIPTEVFTGIGL